MGEQELEEKGQEEKGQEEKELEEKGLDIRMRQGSKCTACGELLLTLGGESGDIMAEITKLSEVKRFWKTLCELGCCGCRVQCIA
jgi:hypothetical protein